MTRTALSRRWMAHPSRGQSLIIVALMFVVLFGFAGLALDAGHLYLVHRNLQNAVDAAALAAGKRMVGNNPTAPPVDSTAGSVQAAYNFTWANGFPTTFNTACDGTTPGTPSRFHTVWFDVNGGTCNAPTGFKTRVDVYVPPRTLVSNCTSVPYNCVEVIITQQVQNYLMGVLGQPITVVQASASAFGDPGGAVVTLPAGYAMYLYEPGTTSCVAGMVCFNQALAPARSNLSCTGAGNNCPTLWVRPGSSPMFNGINGNLLSMPADMTAVQSNGDMVLQDATGTTFCDPFGGVACAARTAVGSKGFSINAGSGAKLYCSASTPAATSPACTTIGPGAAAVGPLWGAETGFTPSSWPHTPDTSALKNCGALVLNGESVASHYGPPPATPCAPSAGAPYTIQPGQYQYIVINHGFYVFGGGLYYITGTAPVNSSALGTANGIDHSNEAAGTDWDLCNHFGNLQACDGGPLGTGVNGPLLTAGVWIGHGRMSSSPFVFPTGGSCPLPVPVDGGGGDLTAIIGGGVTMVFGPSSAGFVSTNEVSYISLVGPGLGAQPRESGAPILFDIQNDSYSHLDANTGFGFGSSFKGLIYQRSNAQGGGIEVNPGLGRGSPAISGMVWAYSFTTFGTAGTALDFSGAFGGQAAAPNLSGGDDDNGEHDGGGGGGGAPGGSTEPQILTGATLQAAPGKPGYEQVIMTYADEWKLDAYSAFININGGSPVFFSEGVWNPFPAAGAPRPPASNNPGDAFPAAPVAAQNVRGSYNIKSATDWEMVYNPTSPTPSYFEVTGDWIWGHQQGMAGQNNGNYTATLTYTFPIPSGTTVTVSMFMTDGDRCGDTAIKTWTFNNVGYPGGGRQVLGAVRLVA